MPVYVVCNLAEFTAKHYILWGKRVERLGYLYARTPDVGGWYIDPRLTRCWMELPEHRAINAVGYFTNEGVTAVIARTEPEVHHVAV